MRSILLRLTLTAILLALIGCGVSHEDIDHWKRTQRGPGKITAVLVGTKYARDLRVHAARALIEMKHPNANGLDLLVQAMNAMTPDDREGIIHDLLPSLRAQMRGADQQQTASGPSEPMVRAKDAAYLLLRFASPPDRQELSTELLDWLLTDLNTRALAGQYTAEQVVAAIGPPAAERLSQAFTANDDSIVVAINIAQLINSVATDAAKDAAVNRVIGVAREIASPAANDRLRASAERRLRGSVPQGQPVPPERITRGAEQLRGQFLNLLYEAIRNLNRPAGTDFFITVAADNAVPLDRRKAVLSALANQVRASNAPALLAIATTAPAPNVTTDVELRGLAVDRIGETRNTSVLPQLWTLFDTTNGGEAGNEFTLRWKAGEAILKLGGPSIIPTFVQHLTAARGARGGPAFEGYTFAEINGYALTIGDFSPPPRDVMRGLLANANPHVKALALLFLGAKGEATDQARITPMISDTTAVAGPGWQAAHANTIGGVATRARDTLRRTLGQPAAPAPGGAAAPAGQPAPAPQPAAAH